MVIKPVVTVRTLQVVTEAVAVVNVVTLDILAEESKLEAGCIPLTESGGTNTRLVFEVETAEHVV